ncbi:toxin PIN [Enterococcus faecium]|uniref:toxin PIN n=1 Tax=Enterococcus faecium TaxID=1352 RepID=UPI001CE1000E|nr:toxin PIN [Enterococcus faecium]
MNTRHRRVAKLRNQELNSMKTKFKREYGISAEEAVKLAREFTKALSRMTENIGNAFVSFGKNLQRNEEDKK